MTLPKHLIIISEVLIITNKGRTGRCQFE
jgi:hypothetical protein